MPFRFHMLGLPHTVSTPEYSSCAFTQKVVKLCAMLAMEGHEVIHYGNSLSRTAAENVAVTTTADLERSYPGHDWRKTGWPKFATTDPIYRTFYENAIAQIAVRKQPGDFLLFSFGPCQQIIAHAHPDLIPVESGIGYPDGTFAPYRIFESYAIMHAYMGNKAAKTATNNFWYDAVIPNAFNLNEFAFSKSKHDFFLFLGRATGAKGLHIATDIAAKIKTKLVVAGQTEQWTPDTEFVEYVGVVGPGERKKLLRRAKATICASTFLEPFCGVQIESMISGTPVISSNWGAFTEYNKQGATGFRCRTFEQFLWAANNIKQINPKVCKAWGEEFSLEKIAPLYTDYFQSIKDIYGGKGWYEPRADRKTLATASFQ